MTVATLNPFENMLTWLGVGNVEAALLRASEAEAIRAGGGLPGETGDAAPRGRPARPVSERVLLRSGIVGYRLPALQTSRLAVRPGDLLVFATDGISAGFLKGLTRSASPQPLADRILELHFKGNDDALVLVVRYLGLNHE
jgi:negative regulator of sigma-B (phosphoserine phosphatase)